MGQADEVTDRLRIAYGVASDSELARLLCVGTSTVSNWRARDSIPFPQCVTAAHDLGLSLDWLILGKKTPEGADGGDVGAGAVREGPAAFTAETGVEPRLTALLDWMAALWRDVDEDERGWLVVELRRLRERLRR